MFKCPNCRAEWKSSEVIVEITKALEDKPLLYVDVFFICPGCGAAEQQTVYSQDWRESN